MGPGATPDTSAGVGTAAHIHSASLNGPRGRGGLTDEQLADVSNGIWCCATHGREIDTNAGKGYSVETLRGWRAAREEEARRERTGLATAGAGWIDEIIVFDSPLFASRSTLKLSKATLIESEGSIGKTALFQWITAAFTGIMGERWSWCNVHLDLHYMCPEAHRFESIFDERKRSYIYDNEIIHVAPKDVAIVHVVENVIREFGHLEDLEFFAAALNISKNDVEALAAELNRNGSGFITKLRFEVPPPEEDEEEDKREDDGEEDETPEKDSAPELFLTVRDNGFDQPFRSLSGSETNRVVAEFAAALAREQARRAPTLLLIDGGGWSLDEGSWADLTAFLLTQPFQTILIPSIGTYKDPVWQSVSRVKLRKKSGKTIIE
jgi:hypothetical protein